MCEDLLRMVGVSDGRKRLMEIVPSRRRRRVLITGGSGFIGGAVAALLEPAYDVVVYDVVAPPLSTVCSGNVIGDIRDTDRLAHAMHGAEGVIHLAAQLGVTACQANEELVRDINENGATSLATAVRRTRTVRRVIGVSSSEIYGEGRGRLLHEDDDPMPRSAYGHSKVGLEVILRNLAESRMRSVTVLRAFNVYGPRQRPDFVVSRFCHDALTDTPLVVHGSGEQIRTFTYVDDCASGLLGAFQLMSPPLGSFSLYNLGSRESISIRTLADLVVTLSGAKSPVRLVQYSDPATGRAADQEVHIRIPNTTKAETALGFRARIPLVTGLSRTLSWYRHQLTHEVGAEYEQSPGVLDLMAEARPGR